MNITTNDPWERLAPQIDTALSDLGEQDRQAIVLRYLEQRSLPQVAEALHVSEDTARQRVGRAIEKLRATLGRRGLPLPAGVMCAALVANGLHPAPIGLVAASVKAGLSLGTNTGAGVVRLVVDVIWATRLTRLKYAAAFASVGLLLVASWTYARRTVAPAPTAATNAEVQLLIIHPDSGATNRATGGAGPRAHHGSEAGPRSDGLVFWSPASAHGLAHSPGGRL